MWVSSSSPARKRAALTGFLIPDTFPHPVLESLHGRLLPVQRRVLSHFQKLLKLAVCLEHLRRHDGDFEVFCFRKVDAMSRERRKSRVEL